MLSCAVLVPATVLLLDRTVSSWAAETTRGVAIFIALTRISEVLLGTSTVVLIAAGLAWLLGWRPGRAGRTVVVACLAVFVSWAVKEELKYAFGRTWPETWTNNNPSWIRDGVFGFFPFHGGSGWASFPSGHTTVIAAAMMVLACAYPRLRLLWALPVLLVAVGLIGADYHFLGDIVAGAYLGAALRRRHGGARVERAAAQANRPPPYGLRPRRRSGAGPNSSVLRSVPFTAVWPSA